ncbi:MAG: hypothetical protein A3F68_12365 [Acidobacteria bacterium RIFCSPLOWO2_12_FULL_54_10]|nr:MAG: hypothetical protein A3F68_12365 [Acidobacteria bacterium RIFCSPLOWO2_12_FULL_54_10]OFW14624.1 MAG: hypothetical protein A3H27_07025 [Acidobacteria bacterium RIFCSPLOWO2_02_FULL_59_13]
MNNFVRTCQDVVFREIDGEGVLLNLKTGIYFGLNATGTRIWNLIEQHGSLLNVAEAMKSEYDVNPTILEQNLIELMGQLLERGLVQISLDQGRE